MAKVLFVVRKTKSKKTRYILYCRVTANKIEREFSTEEVITDPNLWDQPKQVYLKEGSHGEYINLLCDKLKYNIKTIALNYHDPENVHPSKIIEVLKTPKKKPYTVAELVRLYLEWENKNLDLSGGTKKHHACYLKNFIDFEVHTLFVSDFTLQVAESFKLFLKEEKNCQHKTRRSRHIEFFKKAFDHAVKEGLIKEHGIVNYTFERDKKKPNVFLNKTEREAWAKLEFKNRCLLQCRDLALYQMATGVEYGNIWGKHTVKDIPGVGKVIEGRRNKGDKSYFSLPCDAMAEAIIQKYNGALPYYDISTYLKNIKIIAYDFLGIEKKVSTHTFRKTFSMKMKEDGWPTEAIQGMLGHKSIRTTETYYMEYSPALLLNEMARRLH